MAMIDAEEQSEQPDTMSPRSEGAFHDQGLAPYEYSLRELEPAHDTCTSRKAWNMFAREERYQRILSR